MKIKDYIITLYDNNMYPTIIKTHNDFNFYENSFDVSLNNDTVVTITIIKYICVDPNIVEFLDSNEEILARAKGFDSVL